MRSASSAGTLAVRSSITSYFSFSTTKDCAPTTPHFKACWVDTPQLDSLILAATDPHFGPSRRRSTRLASLHALPRFFQALVPPAESNSFPISVPERLLGASNVGSPTGTYGSYVTDPSGGGLTTVPEFEFANVFFTRQVRGATNTMLAATTPPGTISSR